MQRTRIIKELKENKPPELDAKTILQCYKIIELIGKEPGITGRQLSNLVGIPMQEIRKYILYIRRENIKFQNPTGKYFITANKSGYQLTKNKKVLERYLKALNKRFKNLYLQMLHLELVILNNNV